LLACVLAGRKLVTDQTAPAQGAAVKASADPAYANYALGVLFVVMLLNFLDRQIMAILVEPIKEDLGLTDTQAGLMTGLSFALFYTTLGVPIALIADRWHRPKVIGISLALWSAFTVMCGLATNFWQMFAARLGVGVGEAGSGPASHSLLANLFPPEKRAGALGIYGMAVPFGAFIAYAAGGWVVQNFDWRMAFFLAGAPGLLFAMVVWFTIREPRPPTPLSQVFKPVPGQLSFLEAFRELALKPTYWQLIFAGVLVQFVAYGFAGFQVSYFVRVHGIGTPTGEWDFATMGVVLGIMIGVSGMLGAWSGGWVADRVRKYGVSWTLIVPAIMMVLSVPLFILGLHQDKPIWAVVLFAAPTIAATFYYGPTFAAIQQLARDETRAVAVSVYLLIAGLAGMGLGPVFVGVLSDLFAKQGNSSGDALVLAISLLTLFNAWAGVHFFLAGRALQRIPA
jgi:MFS transporter, Spinster family, sphingosine-1-phosphate transporter